MAAYANAEYVRNTMTGETDSIRVDINGISSIVPIDQANTDYQALMLLVGSGQITIAPADKLAN